MLVVVLFLVWIMQVLRLFDLVTAKGQDILTLMGQAVLLTPPLGRTVFYIAIGIGIGRALRQFQASKELHIVHVAGRVGALWSGILWFAFFGMLLIAAVANWLEPEARSAYVRWSAQVTADLVGRALSPNTFREITPGLVVEIGGRAPNGDVTGFFAQDNRDAKAQKTFQAERATILSDAQGYYLDLKDGSLQYVREDGDFSELAFSSYRLSIDRLGGSQSVDGSLEEKTTWAILHPPAGRKLTAAERLELEKRFSEPVRLLALALLVGALTSFPSARRGRVWLPIELVVIVVALLDRLLNNLWLPPLLGHSLGAAIMLGVALPLLGWRLFGFYLPAIRGRPA